MSRSVALSSSFNNRAPWYKFFKPRKKVSTDMPAPSFGEDKEYD
jgi:hypothetical protein